MCVATAARKKQAKTQRGSGAKSRGATPARGGKSRAPRVTGLRRAQPAAKKTATKRASKPVTKRAGVSAAKKRTAAKRVAKPVARKVARTVAPKPVARRRAVKPVAKRPARKPIVRATTKLRQAAKPVPKRPAAKPAPKRAVRKPAARRVAAAVPPAFAAQRATADARGLLLFELARARAAVKAAIQGLTGASALLPTAPGKWSSFEIVLHLSERDRVRLDEFDRTLAGEPRTWADMHDPEMGLVNESHLAPLRAHTWDEAVRRMDSLRDELLQRLDGVPSEPEHVWKAGHAFGDMMWGLPEHDRLHATQIKNARIGGTPPLEA